MNESEWKDRITCPYCDSEYGSPVDSDQIEYLLKCEKCLKDFKCDEARWVKEGSPSQWKLAYRSITLEEENYLKSTKKYINTRKVMGVFKNPRTGDNQYALCSDNTLWEKETGESKWRLIYKTMTPDRDMLDGLVEKFELEKSLETKE